MTRKKTTPTTIASPPSHARIRPPEQILEGSSASGAAPSGCGSAQVGAGAPARRSPCRGGRRGRRGHAAGCGRLALESRDALRASPSSASTCSSRAPRRDGSIDRSYSRAQDLGRARCGVRVRAGLSYETPAASASSSGVYSMPCASATASYVRLPPIVLTPRASSAFALTAPTVPRSASCST